MYEALRRRQRENTASKLLVEVKEAADGVHGNLVPDAEIMCVLLASPQPFVDIVERVLDACHRSAIPAVGSMQVRGLCWCPGLRRRSLRVVVLPVNESVSAGSSLDLTQTHQITALEVSTAVFKLPQRALRIASVKDISLCAVST